MRKARPVSAPIGPNILILPPLNPMHVAEEAATLDVLTGGNYILGIGLGYRQPEFDAFGIGLSERAPRFNESIALMRRLWTEERVSHKGRFYTVNDAGISVKPVRPGGPPLYIAGEWPRGMNIDPSGTFLYAANQNTDNIAVFRISPASGKLQFSKLVNTPTPVDVEFGPVA